MKNPTVITFANLKGGVGKSLSTFMTARHLIERGRRVLMIDIDPRATLTGWSKVVSRTTISDVLGGAVNPNASLRSAAQVGKYDIPIVAADLKLINVAFGLNSRQFDRVEALHNAIHSDSYAWEYILVDCPGAAEVLMINGLYAADLVMIPSQPEQASIEAIIETRGIIARAERAKKEKIDEGPIIVTMADERTVGHRSGIQTIKTIYGICAIIPDRKGVDAEEQLFAAYAPVADYIEQYRQQRLNSAVVKVTA